jgi:hypothetical protein
MPRCHSSYLASKKLPILGDEEPSSYLGSKKLPIRSDADPNAFPAPDTRRDPDGRSGSGSGSPSVRDPEGEGIPADQGGSVPGRSRFLAERPGGGHAANARLPASEAALDLFEKISGIEMNFGLTDDLPVRYVPVLDERMVFGGSPI